MGIAFYMPTLALGNAVVLRQLSEAGANTEKVFPVVRMFGTVGFIAAMWTTDLAGWQATYGQFVASAVLGMLLFGYTFTLKACPVKCVSATSSAETKKDGKARLQLFQRKELVVFFLLAMLPGVCQQVTDGFANPYLTAFGSLPQYALTFGVQHANILISLSQISETLCLLLVPVCLRKMGIKPVMVIAMACWVLRFALLAVGNPGDGIGLFVASMLVYGVAFDFFTIASSLHVDRVAPSHLRAGAQGWLMFFNNGVGATLGSVGAQWVLNSVSDGSLDGWRTFWGIFAGYACCLIPLFVFCFRSGKKATPTMSAV